MAEKASPRTSDSSWKEKNDISSKENAPYFQQINSSLVTELDTKPESKEEITLNSMDIDKELMRTKKRGRNDNQF